MNEQDKAAARRALEEQRLTIEQVEEIKVEVGRTGRSFEDIARTRGHLPPLPPPAPPPAPAAAPAPAARPAPKQKIPLLYEALIVITLLIVLGVPISVLRLLQSSKKDVDLALESERSTVEADRKAGEARAGYQRSLIEAREARALEALKKARGAMASATALSDTKDPRYALSLNEAFVAYNTYLEVLPDDADVRIERARTHQLRRNFDLAIVDLERAAELKPDRAPALRDQVAQLRLLLARTPK